MAPTRAQASVTFLQRCSLKFALMRRFDSLWINNKCQFKIAYSNRTKFRRERTYLLIYVQTPENNKYIERKLLSPKYKE